MLGRMHERSDLLARTTPRLILSRELDEPSHAREAVRTGSLVRLRPGAFVTADDWNGAHREDRARLMSDALIAQ